MTDTTSGQLAYPLHEVAMALHAQGCHFGTDRAPGSDVYLMKVLDRDQNIEVQVEHVQDQIDIWVRRYHWLDGDEGTESTLAAELKVASTPDARMAVEIISMFVPKWGRIYDAADLALTGTLPADESPTQYNVHYLGNDSDDNSPVILVEGELSELVTVRAFGREVAGIELHHDEVHLGWWNHDGEWIVSNVVPNQIERVE